MPPRLCSVLPKGNFIRRFVLLLTFLYLTVTALFFCTSHTSRISSNINNNNIRDREVLLGKFLLDEKSSNFSFETFQKNVAASLPVDEFKIKLDPEIFELKDIPLKKYFFQLQENIFCFTDGTDIELSKAEDKCSCKMLNSTTPLYYGDECGIPLAVWQSSAKNASTWQRRSEPRRLIYALPLNHEFDIFETRLAMHYDVVDVFIVGESNRTNSGGIKEPFFLFRFSAGWLKEWQEKLLYVFQGDFPVEGYENGVIADGYMRRHLTRNGFSRLAGVRPDDLFVYTDGDELILPEILTFLKLYNGYSEPVAFKYKWSIYGFYWQVQEDHFGQHKTPEPGAMSVEFFRDFYRLDSSHVRTHDFLKRPKMLGDYQAANRTVGIWAIFDAGWHCSWCFSPEGIRKKLLDAPKSDYPRYGDDVAKTQVDYIKRLIKHGLYFNLSAFRKGGKEMTVDEDPELAPKYVLDHQDRMGYLVTNPFTNSTFSRIKFHRIENQVTPPN